MLGLFTNHVFVMFLTIILVVFILNRQCLLLWSSTGAKFSLLESLLIFFCVIYMNFIRKYIARRWEAILKASFDTIYNLVQNFSSRAMLNFVATS